MFGQERRRLATGVEMSESTQIEEVLNAYRERGLDGRIADHPAWHDLSVDGRIEAFDETLRQRRLEQALHPNGFSTTVSAVMARIAR